MQKAKRIKSRHARVLFDKDSPFTHKVVPDKTKYKDSSGNIEEDEFAMARFEWQENYKSTMKRKE